MDVFLEKVLLTEVIDELMPLIKNHFKEISWHHKNGGDEMDLNLNLFELLQKNGMFHVFIARINGEIVGYTSYFLNRHNHINAKQAYQDSIYVKPLYRKGIAGIAVLLIEFAEQALSKEGAKYIMNSVADNFDFGYSKLLRRMGYSLIDQNYGKKVNHV